jgi:hypothetical protein
VDLREPRGFLGISASDGGCAPEIGLVSGAHGYVSLHAIGIMSSCWPCATSVAKVGA